VAGMPEPQLVDLVDRVGSGVDRENPLIYKAWTGWTAWTGFFGKLYRV
jgi:hypothetical protein